MNSNDKKYPFISKYCSTFTQYPYAQQMHITYGLVTKNKNNKYARENSNRKAKLNFAYIYYHFVTYGQKFFGAISSINRN